MLPIKLFEEASSRKLVQPNPDVACILMWILGVADLALIGDALTVMHRPVYADYSHRQFWIQSSGQKLTLRADPGMYGECGVFLSEVCGIPKG